MKTKMTGRDWALFLEVISMIIGFIWLYLHIVVWARWLVVSSTLGALIVIDWHDLVNQWRELWPLQMWLWLVTLGLMFGTIAVSRLGLH